jgi:hypothetical protein
MPDDRWVQLALLGAIVVAALSGYGFYWYQVRARSIATLSEGAREELAALQVPARATAELERTWVADGFTTGFFVAPVGPMPCNADLATDDEQLAALHDAQPGDLLVALALATHRIENGRFAEAEQVTTRALDRTSDDERIIAAARAAGSTLDLSDASVSTVVHLHHALGVARLSQSSTDPPWVSLKNVIGSVKAMSRRRLMPGATTRGQAAASRLLIDAPGCSGKASLSSYDLFNNLIVAYMRGKFTGASSEREREFSRAPKNYPSALHRLLVAQVARARANDWQDEAQLWALSNVEQVIDWRFPDDARLAVNAVEVIDWWMTPERCPADVCTPELNSGMQPIRNGLIEQALRRRNVSNEQRAEFARAAVRLLATSSIDRRRVSEHAALLKEWLAPKEARVLDDLLHADTARAALPRFTFAPEPDAEPPHAKLGPRADRWYTAARTDLARAATEWAKGRPPAEQRHALIAIRQFLGEAERPEELTQLENLRPFSDRLRLRLTAAKWFWATLALLLAALIWLILTWIIAHVRERRLLRISLYNVEYDHLAASDPHHTSEMR